MLVFLHPRVLLRVADFPVASLCLWGKLENLTVSNVSKQVVMLFCVVDVALFDIPTCLITCRKRQNRRTSRRKCSFFCIHASRTKWSFWCSHLSLLACLVFPWRRRVYGGSCKTSLFVVLPTVKIAGRLAQNAGFSASTCLVASRCFSCSVAVSMGEAGKPDRFECFQAGCHSYCVATPVLLSRRENRSGAIGLSIDIFISHHNRYFNIVIFNIRVSIRVRGLHLVFLYIGMPLGEIRC